MGWVHIIDGQCIYNVKVQSTWCEKELFGKLMNAKTCCIFIMYENTKMIRECLSSPNAECDRIVCRDSPYIFDVIMYRMTLLFIWKPYHALVFASGRKQANIIFNIGTHSIPLEWWSVNSTWKRVSNPCHPHKMLFCLGNRRISGSYGNILFIRTTTIRSLSDIYL